MIHRKIVLLFLVISSLITASFTPAVSSYSFWSNILDCNNVNYMRGCRHEIGHKMDDDLGLISESSEFGTALTGYMLHELKTEKPSELSEVLIGYPGVFSHYSGQGSAQQEIYAGIYSWANGDLSKIPQTLRPFFSSDQSYLDLYECLSRENRLNLCNRTSISYIKN